MKMFVHQAVSSTGMELLAYHHNEAAAGKDVCDAPTSKGGCVHLVEESFQQLNS